ncbi:retrotransposon protein, putative, ty1-copia subclass [Tanacetum coccineum]
MRPYGSTMLSTWAGKFNISSEVTAQSKSCNLRVICAWSDGDVVVSHGDEGVVSLWRSLRFNLALSDRHPTYHGTTTDRVHCPLKCCFWLKKRNCLVYLAELLKKKKQVGSASSSGIFTIELFAFPNKSWVYDTGCGTHICITKQGFREARKLKQGALYLYVGNGVRAQVEAIGSYDLVLPNGLVICLDNCHYAPSITRGVVSVHRLVENGFVQCFTNFGISVSKNNVFYFNVIPSNGIYEIDMHDLVSNVNSIYNVSTKRAKHNLGSTYLWHCRLAHISKKRIEKMQQEGLLNSTDDESFD